MPDTLTHTPPELADIPEYAVLAVDGEGDPDGDALAKAIGALQPEAPIEGTWWSGDDRLASEHELPGGEWASTLHVGPYEELPVAYAALLEHLRERGHEPRAPVLETYLTDPTVAEPPELVTRVAVAMAPAGGGAPA
jgi:hypothetical protein